MKKFKKILCTILVLCIVFGCISVAAAAKGVVYKSPTSNYEMTKISHPDAKQGETDGLIEYPSGDYDRGQSYAWSAVGYKDYIYVGTCYAAVYSTILQMVKFSPDMDLEGLKKGTDAFFNGAQYLGDPKNNPEDKNRSVIVKFNTKTGDVKIVDGPNDFGGFRAAVEFKDKLYFACATDSPYLLEIDPNKNDAKQKVFVCERPDDKTVSVGIRGLTVVGDKLISSAIGNEGAYIVASSEPSKGQKSFKTIATQKQLFDYPAYHYYDDIFGGSIWDMVCFEGKLYFTVVTGKKDHKQSFAMFVGEENDKGVWEYRLLVGEKDKGAKYPFGLGHPRSGAANLIVHDDHIYIGSYNDPMADMPDAVFKQNWYNLYLDFSNPVNIWRMDKDENFEMVMGDPNELFPEVKGNMGEGFGDGMNQYIWRMASYDGKLYAGTIDLSSIMSPMGQLLNGDIFRRDPAEWKTQSKYIYEFIKYIIESNKPQAEKAALAKDASSLSKDLVLLSALSDKGGVNDLKNTDRFLEILERASETYDKIKSQLPENITAALDKVLNFNAVRNFYSFTQVCKYLSKSKPGFDLAVSNDGLNFEMITRDGFGDKYNHGLRTFAINDDGLFCGTANPFYGAQVWKIKEVGKTPEDGSKPVVPETQAPDIEDEDLKPNLPENEDADTDSQAEEQKEEAPNTGVEILGSVLALGTLSAGVALAFMSRKKKYVK